MRIDKSQREREEIRDLNQPTSPFGLLLRPFRLHGRCNIHEEGAKGEREGVEQFRKSSDEESKQTQQSRQGAERGSDNVRQY